MEQPVPTSPFLELPPELRNSIYDLVFSRDISTVPIKLRDATPPRKALALVNRQLYEETYILCRDAYRKFWTTNDFKITKSLMDRVPEFYKHLPIIERRTMGRFKSLTIHFDICCIRTQSTISNEAQLVDHRGVWRMEHRNVAGRVILVEYHVVKAMYKLRVSDPPAFDTIEEARAECEKLKKPLRLARQTQSMVGFF